MIGIILAGGKGSRLKCTTQNKTTLPVNGKPMIQFGVDLFEGFAEKTVIVVGAFAESVKESVHSKQVLYANQTKRLGTGHAFKVAVTAINKNKIETDILVVGYGDHMVHYTKDIIEDLVSQHTRTNSAVTLVATKYNKPNELAWGRVVTNSKNQVIKVVEQKDATNKEKNINLLNAGFYCVDFKFAQKAIRKLTKSPVTGEYYITELISLAADNNGKVGVFTVPFDKVGTGINTPDQYEALKVSSSHAVSKKLFSLKLWQAFSKTNLPQFFK